MNISDLMRGHSLKRIFRLVKELLAPGRSEMAKNTGIKIKSPQKILFVPSFLKWALE